MNTIKLKNYNKIENSEKEKVGFLISETFVNSYFKSVNRESIENYEKSLWKFIDSHHDNRLTKTTQKLLEGKITNDEFKILNDTFSKLKSFCKKNKMPFSTANASIFRALFQARIINKLITNKEKKLNVAEIGPGSAWLSLLLYQKKHNVYSIENTQSHYCFQSKIFDYFAKNDFSEFAFEKTIEFNKLNHIPWWKICRPTFSLPKQDIVTSNHMLQECSTWALMFYISLINRVLKSDGFWLIEGLGARYQNGPALKFIKKEIKKYGFKIYNLSWHLPLADGIYVISRNPNKLSKTKYDSTIDLEAFEKKFGQKHYPNLLTSSEFLTYANIPH